MKTNLKPIRSDEELSFALARLRELWGAPEGSAAADEFEVLGLIVRDYELRHHPVPPPDPVEAVLFVMDQRGLEPKDLIPYLGAQSRVSEFLNRKRGLTVESIRRLSEGLGISAEVLVRPFELQPRSA